MNLFGMITTRSSRAYTDHALRSFFSYTPLGNEDHFILIDNDQSDYQPPAELTSKIELIRNPTPEGFAANGNSLIAAALARKQHLFLLNNDVIFTNRWLAPLMVDDSTILTPLSNREVHYSSGISNVRTNELSDSLLIHMPPMELNEYLGHEMMVQAIAESHHRKNSGYLIQICLPFFAVKIPFRVMAVIGRFDESFGLGGGEDFDYAIRANLAGFSVAFALGSYLLHFGGRSTWNSVDEKNGQAGRQSLYRQRFEEKWGFPLLDLIMNENVKVLDSIADPSAPKRELVPREIISKLMTDKNPKISI